MEKTIAQDLPDDIKALKLALILTRSELAVERAKVSSDQALIAHLKLLIAKLKQRAGGYGSGCIARFRLKDQVMPHPTGVDGANVVLDFKQQVPIGNSGYVCHRGQLSGPQKGFL
jgi:hypothetical protein